MRTQADRLGLGALRTLAALLLVDGRLLSATELARIALPWGGVSGTVRYFWLPKLRAAGCEIETVAPYGYRLTAVPPDALLPDLLVMARLLQQEHPTRLWELFGRAPTTTTTRPSPIPAVRWSA